jgi:hypothetical protein
LWATQPPFMGSFPAPLAESAQRYPPMPARADAVVVNAAGDGGRLRFSSRSPGPPPVRWRTR